MGRSKEGMMRREGKGREGKLRKDGKGSYSMDF